MAATVGQSTADARSDLLVVVGAGGTAEYAGEFAVWVDSWRAAAKQGNAAWRHLGAGTDQQQDQTSDREALKTEFIPMGNALSRSA